MSSIAQGTSLFCYIFLCCAYHGLANHFDLLLSDVVVQQVCYVYLQHFSYTNVCVLAVEFY